MKTKIINKCREFLWKVKESNIERDWCLCAFSSDQDILRIMKNYYPKEFEEMQN